MGSIQINYILWVGLILGRNDVDVGFHFPSKLRGGGSSRAYKVVPPWSWGNTNLMEPLHEKWQFEKIPFSLLHTCLTGQESYPAHFFKLLCQFRFNSKGGHISKFHPVRSEFIFYPNNFLRKKTKLIKLSLKLFKVWPQWITFTSKKKTIL